MLSFTPVFSYLGALDPSLSAPRRANPRTRVPAGSVGIAGEQTLLVDTTDDGSIVLRQAGVYPLETYSDARLREFEEADRLTATEKARLQRKLKSTR